MWFWIPVPIPRIQKAIPAHLCADFDDDNDGDEDDDEGGDVFCVSSSALQQLFPSQLSASSP